MRRVGREDRYVRQRVLPEIGAEGQRITVFEDGRALIRGVTDEAKARSIYARYIGA